MAELSIFLYRRRASALHGLDARAKFVSFACCSAALFLAPTGISLVLIPALLIALRVAGKNPRSVVSSLRALLPMLVLIVAVRAFFSEGEGITLFPGWIEPFDVITLYPKAASEGLLFCLRLIEAALLSGLFLSVSSVSDIADAVAWICKPFPFLKAADIDLAFALSVSYVPLIMEAGERIRFAQASRCVDGRLGAARASAFVRALLESVIRMSGTTALALESRAYGRERTPPDFHWRKKDSVALSVSIMTLIASIVARSIGTLP
jgi:energy-coupling factor transporter transmembrane protein EcfT